MYILWLRRNEFTSHGRWSQPSKYGSMPRRCRLLFVWLECSTTRLGEISTRRSTDSFKRDTWTLRCRSMSLTHLTRQDSLLWLTFSVWQKCWRVLEMVVLVRPPRAAAGCPLNPLLVEIRSAD